MGLFSKIFGQKDPVIEDARRVYSKLMRQSRDVAFYGVGKAADNYDGRIDMLTLHIAVVLNALNTQGEQGSRLSQGIFDVMRDDFEVAMREEGLSDTGIKRRIKPMMQLFYTRVKSYVEALQANPAEIKLKEALDNGLLKEGGSEYSMKLSSYVIEFAKKLNEISLGQIALCEFVIPSPPR